MRTLLGGLGGLYLIIIAALGPAWAEDSVPLRAGRVSLAASGAGYRPAGGDWSEAALNLPVATGTALRTGDKGSAEFRVGDTVVALAGGSEVEIARLEPHLVQITLRRGRIGVALRSFGDEDSVEIALPRGAVHLLEPGRYDIDGGAETRPGRIAVFAGRARFTGGAGDSTIAPGSLARFDGNGPAATSAEPPSADGFDAAWQSRVDEDQSTPARLHLSPELAGLAALDNGGHWQAVGFYGAVWFPDATPDGWAPYRDGSWRWIQPWGWTWIDNAPWGFAPSHYGRWARINDRWGWIPGKPVPNPAYAPAVVAFIGTPGVGLSYADAFSPAIAWFPLAPGEVYWPGFTRDIDVIARLNAGEIEDLWTIRRADNGGPPPEIVTTDYQNRRFASAVPRAAFMAGRPIVPALLPIPEARLEAAPLIIAATPFPPAPTPRNVLVASVPAKALALVAAARAAVPVLAAAARKAEHRVARAVHLVRETAASHLAALKRGARALARVHVVSSAHAATGGHRHVAASHGRAR
jgi:hypothetical protein